MYRHFYYSEKEMKKVVSGIINILEYPLQMPIQHLLLKRKIIASHEITMKKKLVHVSLAYSIY